MKSVTHEYIIVMYYFTVVSSVAPVLTPSMGGFFTPVNPIGPTHTMAVQPAGPSFVPYKAIDLVNKLSGGGLSIQYR